jgi:hypothetical protein
MVEYRQTLRFNAATPGDPVRMVLEVPTESREVTALFDFADLILP